MPFLARWPGVIAPGAKPEQLIQNIAYAPTFLEIAGLEIPAEVQGRSLMALFKGKAEGWRESLYYSYSEFGEHRVPQHFGVRTARHKLMYFPRSKEWNLFDLKTDPNEMKSVHAEREYLKVRRELTEEFHRLREHFGAPSFAE